MDNPVDKQCILVFCLQWLSPRPSPLHSMWCVCQCAVRLDMCVCVFAAISPLARSKYFHVSLDVLNGGTDEKVTILMPYKKYTYFCVRNHTIKLLLFRYFFIIFVYIANVSILMFVIVIDK